MCVSKLQKISETDMVENWDENWIGISSTHKSIHDKNAKIQERHKFENVRARATKTRKDKKGKYLEVNGGLSFQPKDKVWFGKTKANQKTNMGYEAAYFITADMIQGASLNETIVIDTENMSEGFLYTAVSRCRDINQLRLI